MFRHTATRPITHTHECPLFQYEKKSQSFMKPINSDLFSYAPPVVPPPSDNRKNQTVSICKNGSYSFDATFGSATVNSRQNQTVGSNAIVAESKRPITATNRPRTPHLYTDKRIRERSASRDPPPRRNLIKTVAFGRTTTIVVENKPPTRPQTAVRASAPQTSAPRTLAPRTSAAQPSVQVLKPKTIAQPHISAQRTVTIPEPQYQWSILQNEMDDLKSQVVELLKDNIELHRILDERENDYKELFQRIDEM
ncbi:hypothetical protein M3Y98_00137700 [Aphelenchoides besseyi]|nr:hypothetical protein M3Y98_00137700 [Aphelenchoides besseyi]KAI6199671.1 hypothetical protein M3Y96_00651600 [Aphelenchoides besseyi]